MRRGAYLARVLAWLVQFAIAFALWSLYVGKIQADEALFGAAAAAIAAFAARVVFEKHIAPLRAQWRSVAQAWRLPKELLVGTWQILAALARQLFLGRRAESLFFGVPFDPGGDDDESAFRRALAIALTCATPNSVVIGIDREHRLLLFHQVWRSPVAEMTRRLGASG